MTFFQNRDRILLLCTTIQPPTPFSKSSQAFLHQNKIHILHPWPVISTDLNPIEHLWDLLDSHVRNESNPPQTLVQVEHELTQAWNNLPQAPKRNLFNDTLQYSCDRRMWRKHSFSRSMTFHFDTPYHCKYRLEYVLIH